MWGIWLEAQRLDEASQSDDLKLSQMPDKELNTDNSRMFNITLRIHRDEVCCCDRYLC
jgi:hypothetical protein